MKRQWGNDFQQKATNFMWQQRYPVALLFPTTSPVYWTTTTYTLPRELKSKFTPLTCGFEKA